MKEIAIFYRNRENQPAIKYISDNIYSVLGEFVNITNYYLSELPSDEKINADAYLVCYEETLQHLVDHIDDFSKVIVITRSIQKKHLESIMRIPKGTSVLVVNDSKESTLQTIYMFYELGIGHLKFIPYDYSSQERGMYDNVHHAVVATFSEYLVPTHIKNIHSIHNREVSFETFQKLIVILELKNPIIQRNLLHKIRGDMDVGSNFIDSYMSNYLKDQMMTNFVEESRRCVVLLDYNNLILYLNEKAYRTFSLNSGDHFALDYILPKNLLNKNFIDEMISYNDENYLAEKEDILLYDTKIGTILILQNEKDVRDTEITLSRRLKDSGFYAKYTFNDIIHHSTAMQECIGIAQRVSPSDYTILIRGESGTGKELMAQSIHNFSNRKNRPFVAVNCAAIPDTLLESELFGYEEGSFTGAKKHGKVGLFEHAQGGTIFLDEIGTIPLNLQARLLRVIQERQVMRIGSDHIINIDVRIIAATNVNLEQSILDGNFRDDLFYRLNVISLNIAPLRERTEDILPLLNAFLGKTFNNISPADQTVLLNYKWPGNIRELENVASYYKILGEIPAYISSKGNQILSSRFNEKIDPITPTKNTDLKSDILQIIANHSGTSSGIGRRAILSTLANKKIFIGEGVLKRELSTLKSEGLIYSDIGRSGSVITESGRCYLANNINQ